jgi:hypothetical protein
MPNGLESMRCFKEVVDAMTANNEIPPAALIRK